MAPFISLRVEEISAGQLLDGILFKNFFNRLKKAYRACLLYTSMLKSDADKRNASAEIYEWLRNDSENTPVHENVILRLFRDVYDNKLNYLNPGNYLGSLRIFFSLSISSCAFISALSAWALSLRCSNTVWYAVPL